MLLEFDCSFTSIGGGFLRICHDDRVRGGYVRPRPTERKSSDEIRRRVFSLKLTRGNENCDSARDGDA